MKVQEYWVILSNQTQLSQHSKFMATKFLGTQVVQVTVYWVILSNQTQVTGCAAWYCSSQYFVDFQEYWNWPKSHFDLGKRMEIETTLLCFAHSPQWRNVPEEIVTHIIKHWGSAVKINFGSNRNEYLDLFFWIGTFGTDSLTDSQKKFCM